MTHLHNTVKAIIFSFIVLIPFFSFQNVYSQEGGSNLVPVCIGYYNVENLFDTINDPERNDDEFTPEGNMGWTSNRYNEKLNRLAEVISKIGIELTPDGPAVMGLSEIENEEVVWDLVREEGIKDRDYQVIYKRGRDRRIDNAFIYNPKYFEVTATQNVPVIIEDMPDFRTRNQLVISGLLLDEPIHFIVAHWPSRSGGEKRSMPLRIAAAETGRSIVDSLKALDPGARIIYMGDLNDDPTDRSVKNHLKTGRDKDKLKPDQLFNPFEDFARQGIGSLAYRDSWNMFDQIILSQSLLEDDFSDFTFYKAEVFNKPFLRQTSGRFQGYPFRSHAGGVYLGGYSDHFPTYIYLIREAK